MLFGVVMNGEDAIGAMQDVAMINGAAERARGQREAAERRQENDALGAAATALKQKNETIRQLIDRVQASDETCAEVLIASRSAKETIDFLVKEIAKLTGEPVQKIQQRANAVRTQVYERFVDDSLKTGGLKFDPRANGTAQRRDWYRPDLA